MFLFNLIDITVLLRCELICTLLDIACNVVSLTFQPHLNEILKETLNSQCHQNEHPPFNSNQCII